jgi:1,4-alpha-glucan branching enzyme
MERIHPDGVFEARFPDRRRGFSYRLRVETVDGRQVELDDAYRFPPVATDRQLARFVRGEHPRASEVLGARVLCHRGVAGTCFAVWAPRAVGVHVMGTFNRWDGRCHPMRRRGDTGVWELFIPDVDRGAVYKYEIRTERGDQRLVKADPYGFAMEVRPNTASVVWDLDRYRWGDAAWLESHRRRTSGDVPISIYEVHLGSWRRGVPAADTGADGRQEDDGVADTWLGYRDIADQLIPYVKEMGFTHIELLPITEHPFDGSWGYQTVGYFAPTSRHGTPDDFRYFVDRAHQSGIGVFLDWVPGHFPRDPHGLGLFDGTHLYEHADPRRGAHPDWGTYIFDFGRPEVRAFLVSSALFWLREYHIDGLRVDAVASMLYLDFSRAAGEWVPNRHGGRENLEAIAFLKQLNDAVHKAHPGAITCAEESSSWPRVTGRTRDGGLGFDLKWNMGWMNDVLRYAHADPLLRKGLHDTLTFSIHYAFDEQFLLPLSHDEVVHGKSSLLGKMPGEPAHKFATLRALFGYMYAHPGKKLLFMGSEIGPWAEWSHDDELEWHLLEHQPHRGLQTYVKELNRLHATEPALYELDFHWRGFEWIARQDAARSVASFVRWSKGKRDFVIVVANFTPMTWTHYELLVPRSGDYELLLSSNEIRFGGAGGEAPPEPWRARSSPGGVPFRRSLELSLPPLSVLYLKRRDATGAAGGGGAAAGRD